MIFGGVMRPLFDELGFLLGTHKTEAHEICRSGFTGLKGILTRFTKEKKVVEEVCVIIKDAIKDEEFLAQVAIETMKEIIEEVQGDVKEVVIKSFMEIFEKTFPSELMK